MKISISGVLLFNFLFLTSLTPVLEAAVLAVDDGIAEEAIGLTGGGTLLVFNRFITTNGMVTDVRIDWPLVANGRLFDIGIWSDPDLNGNPSDAVLLRSLTGQSVANANLITVHMALFNVYDVIDTPVTDSFFVGFAMSHISGEFPASLDQSSTQTSSWAAFGGLAAVNGASLIDNFGFPGNWLIRANVEPDTSVVPEPGFAIFLTTLLSSGLLFRFRPGSRRFSNVG